MSVRKPWHTTAAATATATTTATTTTTTTATTLLSRHAVSKQFKPAAPQPHFVPPVDAQTYFAKGITAVETKLLLACLRSPATSAADLQTTCTRLLMLRASRDTRLDEARLDEARLDEARLDEAAPDEASIDEDRLDEAAPDEASLDEHTKTPPRPDPSGLLAYVDVDTLASAIVTSMHIWSAKNTCNLAEADVASALTNLVAGLCTEHGFFAAFAKAKGLLAVFEHVSVSSDALVVLALQVLLPCNNVLEDFIDQNGVDQCAALLVNALKCTECEYQCATICKVIQEAASFSFCIQFVLALQANNFATVISKQLDRDYHNDENLTVVLFCIVQATFVCEEFHASLLEANVVDKLMHVAFLGVSDEAEQSGLDDDAAGMNDFDVPDAAGFVLRNVATTALGADAMDAHEHVLQFLVWLASRKTSKLWQCEAPWFAMWNYLSKKHNSARVCERAHKLAQLGVLKVASNVLDTLADSTSEPAAEFAEHSINKFMPLVSAVVGVVSVVCCNTSSSSFDHLVCLRHLLVIFANAPLLLQDQDDKHPEFLLRLCTNACRAIGRIVQTTHCALKFANLAQHAEDMLSALRTLRCCIPQSRYFTTEHDARRTAVQNCYDEYELLTACLNKSNMPDSNSTNCADSVTRGDMANWVYNHVSVLETRLQNVMQSLHELGTICVEQAVYCETD